MADVFRKSSIEKLSNPEQLDRMIKVSSPMSWLALLAVLLIVVVTVIWSFVGTLQTTDTVSGVIVTPDNAVSIHAQSPGTLKGYCVDVGAEVAKGDVVAYVQQMDGTIVSVCADLAGKVSAFSQEAGAAVLTGTEVARITPQNVGAQVIVCYVPLAYAPKYQEGMEVLVYPTAVDSQKYGHMKAEIIAVEKYATNTGSFAYVLGSDNMVAEQFAANGPVVAVVCKLETDANTQSGYYWSSDASKNLTISSGTVVTAKVVVEECAPITKLIGEIQDIVEA